MATTEEVKKLAALARIAVDDAELEKFTSEFDAILGYIGQLEKLELPQGEITEHWVKNVMRDDANPHASSVYTEKIVEQFPQKEGDSLVVKQIITHD
jgi:aspartyl-tRNA(Asn)/glutamyl-tRNA(Gln) amidotransferase subunit C